MNKLASLGIQTKNLVATGELIEKKADLETLLRPILMLSDDLALLLMHKYQEARRNNSLGALPIQNYPLNQDSYLLYQNKYKEKQASLKDLLLKGTMLGSLTMPMKSIADDALLAYAQAEAKKAMPTMINDVRNSMDKINWFYRNGAKAVAGGEEGIADTLAQSQAFLKTLKEHNLPTMGGEELENSVRGFKKVVDDTGEVSLGDASSLWDKVKDYNSKASQFIKEHPPISSNKDLAKI